MEKRSIKMGVAVAAVLFFVALAAKAQPQENLITPGTTTINSAFSQHVNAGMLNRSLALCALQQ